MQLTDTDIKSSSRNPLVFGLFQQMDMVEQVGSGIKRIKTDIRKAGLYHKPGTKFIAFLF